MEKWAKSKIEKINFNYPVIFTIRDSDAGSSLHLLRGKAELDEFLSSYQARNIRFSSIKEVDKKTYIEASTEDYAALKEERARLREKERAK